MNYTFPIQFPRPNQRLPRTKAKAEPKLWTFFLLLFVVLHVPLGFAFKLVPYLSTLHAAVSLAISLMFVIKRYPIGWVVAGCAYIVGAEAVWRMTDALVPYEFGKYAVLLVMATAILNDRPRVGGQLPILYAALLVPGALLTIIAVPDFGPLRQILSAELSGPACYVACGLFLLGRTMSRNDVLRCLVAILAPIATVTAITFFGIRTADIQFGASSNDAASGGFGPNQVAAALGLGMLACFLLLTSRLGGLMMKVTVIGLLVWFGIQAALTFSRSGLYYSVASMLAGAAFLVTDVRRFVMVLVLGLILFGLGRFVIGPQLSAFTGGAIEDRFASTDLTGRGDLMKGDLIVFLHHPLLGVGVGLARQERTEAVGLSRRNHTEYTRLLSEHGLLGAIALVLILVISAHSVTGQRPGWPRACSASLVAFGLIFMTGSGMRMAIPSFLLAFAGVRIVNPAFRRARPALAGFSPRIAGLPSTLTI